MADVSLMFGVDGVGEKISYLPVTFEVHYELLLSL